MTKTFKSAVDTWYYVLIAVIPLSVLVPILLAPIPTDKYVAFAIGLLASAIPVWLLFSTIYVVDEKNLRIRSGPFRWTIPLSEIKKIEPSRSLLSSPALSLDRLRIEYGAQRSILVSPLEREAFIQAVQPKT